MESKGKAPADLPRGWRLALALQESLGRCQLGRAPCVTAAFAKPSWATTAEPALRTLARLLQHSCWELCCNTSTVLGWPMMETPHDGTFCFFLATFAGRRGLNHAFHSVIEFKRH